MQFPTLSTPKKAPGPAPDRSWHEKFLYALRQGGNVRAACNAAGIDRSGAYLQRRIDPEFARQWADAIEDATDVLEAIARQRATATKNPSDALLMFLCSKRTAPRSSAKGLMSTCPSSPTPTSSPSSKPAARRVELGASSAPQH
jgi:hypothetical protein